MGWGNTLKIVVKYKGKVLLTKEQISKEYARIEADNGKNWALIKQMMVTSPIDYVSQWGEDCWRSYDKTLQTLSLRFDSAMKNIISNERKLHELSMLSETLSEYEGTKDVRYAVGRYGCNSFTQWFYEFASQFDEDVDFGTIGTCYHYFSKPRIPLVDEYSIRDTFESSKENVDVWFGKLKGYAMMNIKDMYCADCDSEEENVCHSVSDVMFVLDNEYDEYKECIDEDLSLMCRTELALKSIDSVKEYIDYINILKNKEAEWEKQKEELLNKAYDMCNVDRATCWKLPNYQQVISKVDECHERLMKENNIPLQSPVDWNKECYDE